MGGLALLMGHSAAPVDATLPAVAPSQALAEAWALAQTAQLQSERHQDFTALENYRHAFELSGDPTLLLEVARLEHEVGNPARAAHAFELFLERGAGRVGEPQRSFAARQLRVAAAQSARVKLQTNVQGAVVELEAQRGVATSEGFVVNLLLDAGERKLNLSKPGYEMQTVTLSLEPGEMRSLRVDLDKAVGGRSEASPVTRRLALVEAPAVTVSL